ncbi:phospho-acceptor domain-containing protein [Thermosporothrix hazakensis]|jgi:signal transduction histidine kinase|uniref:histidine kinase n=1 Tax=Thermosporothrix hazakensis TaxID=644383 RepID=A0A326U2R2_THEHA|nr:GAF domain-containing sensor histidine kinase [Thermosporothrix hazakensis]PZW26048.1 phospho-acceptor domain-containing protein [Thermosporothrix hazakensis]GCE51307.1 hypothetical protein KTH_61760 [Thermosporothrix hazakensis]
MNQNKPQNITVQSERLLTTLERILAIRTIQLKPALHQAAQLIGEALKAEKVDVLFYETETRSLFVVESNESPMSQRQRRLGLDRYPIANRGRAVEVFLTGKSFRDGHVDRDEAELPGVRTPPPEGMGAVSQIIVRIEKEGKPEGVLMAASSEPDFFTDLDLLFLEAIARWLGVIAHRAELVEQQTQEATERGRHRGAEELLTVMAHDLKNYLTPLKTRLEMIHRRMKKDGQEKDLRDIQAALTTMYRLERLVERLLDVARLDQGLFALNRQTFNGMEMLQEMAVALSTAETPIHIDGPEQVLLFADPDRIQQIIENLLANAVKHAAAHTPVLVKVGREKRDGGTWVHISVHNDGIPISSALLTHLFQPFVAGARSQGVGLGLYLARMIAHAHHGTLNVTSKEGSGTEFLLSLPERT